MRDYSKVSGLFWTGETGRKLRQLGPEEMVVALYLMTAPNSNMIGLYYLPLPTLAHELGLTLEGASKALRRVVETGFCRYDEASETVWVVRMAAHQIGDSLKGTDNLVKAVQKQLDGYRKCAFYAGFLDMYGAAYHLAAAPQPPESRSPFEPPSDSLRSQEQEQEQEREIKTSDAAPLLVLSGLIPQANTRRPIYRPSDGDIEAVWLVWKECAPTAGDKQPGCASIRLALADLAGQGFDEPAAELSKRVRAWFKWYGGEVRKRKADPGYFVAAVGYPQGWFNPKTRRRYMSDDAIPLSEGKPGPSPMDTILRQQADALAEKQRTEGAHANADAA